jgi:hypothetical protein
VREGEGIRCGEIWENMGENIGERILGREYRGENTGERIREREYGRQEQ